MGKGRDLILLILDKYREGLTLAELHEAVAAYELRALVDSSTRDYAEFAFEQIKDSVYSEELAASLSVVLRDGFVMATRPFFRKLRLMLSSPGRREAQRLRESPLGKLINELPLNVETRQHVLRRWDRLVASNIHARSRDDAGGSPERAKEETYSK